MRFKIISNVKPEIFEENVNFFLRMLEKYGMEVKKIQVKIIPTAMCCNIFYENNEKELKDLVKK